MYTIIAHTVTVCILFECVKTAQEWIAATPRKINVRFVEDSRNMSCIREELPFADKRIYINRHTYYRKYLSMVAPWSSSSPSPSRREKRGCQSQSRSQSQSPRGAQINAQRPNFRQCSTSPQFGSTSHSSCERGQKGAKLWQTFRSAAAATCGSRLILYQSS